MSLLIALPLAFLLPTLGIDLVITTVLLLMGTTVEALALAAVVLVVMWLAAGVVLRVGGIGVAATGLLLAVFRHPIGLLLAALGAVLWAAGHWHYALRHHTYKSPLARRLFIDSFPAGPTPPATGPSQPTTEHD